MMAFKYILEKEYIIPNVEYAKMIGVSPTDLLKLELQFLFMLDYSVYVTR